MDAVKLAPARPGVLRAEPLEVVAEVVPQAPATRVELKVEIVSPAPKVEARPSRPPELPPPAAAAELPTNPVRAAAAYARQSERPPEPGLVVHERA